MGKAQIIFFLKKKLIIFEIVQKSSKKIEKILKSSKIGKSSNKLKKARLKVHSFSFSHSDT